MKYAVRNVPTEISFENVSCSQLMADIEKEFTELNKEGYEIIGITPIIENGFTSNVLITARHSD